MQKMTTPFGVVIFLEAPPGIEPGIKVLQTRALPLGYGAIWKTGARCLLLFSFWSGRRGSNSLPPPWQGGALPDELLPQQQTLLYQKKAVCQLFFCISACGFCKAAGGGHSPASSSGFSGFSIRMARALAYFFRQRSRCCAVTPRHPASRVSSEL